MAATGLVALGLLVFRRWSVPLRPSKVTQENLDRVELGMTDDQVEAILGPPVTPTVATTRCSNTACAPKNAAGDEGHTMIEVSSWPPPGHLCRSLEGLPQGVLPRSADDLRKAWMAYLGIYL